VKTPRAATIVATVFGIGYFGFAPGTVMSAVAVPLAVLIALFAGGGMAVLAAAIIALAIGILASAEHVRLTGRDDPSEVVIDELAGQWLACAGVCFNFAPATAAQFALAFLLFRLFDIWKPWPVGWADRELSGGIGVMTDDMIAGLMAGVLVALARYTFAL
jgi:phosphatidylglycerophosphatase A